MSLIKCARCRHKKDEAEFDWQSKAKNTRQIYCKKCRKHIRKIWYQRHKAGHIRAVARTKKQKRELLYAWLRNYLVHHPCVDCGEDNIVCLEFDHVRGKKVESIARMVTTLVGLKTLTEEVEKCDVRCANCHRIKTAKERGWHSLAPAPIPKILPGMPACSAGKSGIQTKLHILEE